MIRLLFPLAAALALAACATSQPPRFDTDEARAVTPEQVLDGPQVYRGDTVVWGGVVAHVENEADETRLELLRYPLDDGQRPDIDGTAGHRFIAIKSGFLEPANYAPGREVTVQGKLDGVVEGKVGERPYTYPVVRVLDHELWPDSEKKTRRDPTPHFNFGFGIILD